MKLKSTIVIICLAIIGIAVYHFANRETSTPLEKYLHSTAYINVHVNGAESLPANATAFFLEFVNPDAPSDKRLCLVTNRHCIKGYTGPVTARFTIKGPMGNPVFGESHEYTFEVAESDWLLLEDTSVELAVLPLDDFEEDFRSIHSSRPFIHYFTEDQIPLESEWANFRNPIEVAMIGYPRGFHDKKNNIPSVYSGWTAGYLPVSFRDSQDFTIHIPSFNQSSGSPVIEAAPLLRQDAWSWVFPKEPLLLGVNWSGVEKYKPNSQVILNGKPIGNSLKIFQDIHLSRSERSYQLLEFKPLIFAAD